MKLHLKKSQWLAICRHAERVYPEECCGLLVGHTEGDAIVVDDVRPARNVYPEGRSRRFAISPADYLKTEKDAERRGLSVVGFYHSHPDHPAAPSRFDLEQAWPNAVYLIQSVQQGSSSETNGFLLNSDRKRFEAIPIIIQEDE